MIVAEVDVADGRLTAVRFPGLGPYSSTPRLLHSSTFQEAPADLPAAGFAARARAAVPFGVDLVGATFADIGAAVRAAVGGAGNADRIGGFTGSELARLTAGWSGFGWKLLPERPLSPAENVALDEVLADRVGKGVRPPTLRFWGWAEPAVVLGRSQVLADAVDLPVASDMGMGVVRRLSGGGAMFVTPAGAITYSLDLPAAAVDGLTIRQSYEVCDGWAVRCLRGLGVDAHYIPVNDIGWAGGKIAGAAQARRAGVVLHHTTLAYDMGEAAMARVLRLGRPAASHRGVVSAAKVVSPLDRQTALSREAVVTALARAFAGRYGGESDEVTADEMAAAERLAVEKYAAEEWTRGTR